MIDVGGKHPKLENGRRDCLELLSVGRRRKSCGMYFAPTKMMFLVDLRTSCMILHDIVVPRYLPNNKRMFVECDVIGTTSFEEFSTSTRARKYIPKIDP